MSLIWLNGALVEAGTARIAPDDRGLTLGDGLYETFPLIDGKPDGLAEHLERLREGCRVLRLPHPDLDVAAAIAALAAANGLSAATIRLTLTRGAGVRGLPPPADPKPTLMIVAGPPAPPPTPVRVIVARSTRRNEKSPLSRIKTLNCLDSILARMEAADTGVDDALLLNAEGRIAEGTASNLLAVIDGLVVTPPVADGAMPGVARGRALAGGAIERSLTVADLSRATALFLSNSLSTRLVREIVIPRD